MLTAFLHMLYSIVSRIVVEEATKLWKDGTVRSIAEEAVSWAAGEAMGKPLKAQAAKERLISEASAKGIKVSRHAATQIVEKMVQRLMKDTLG